MAWLGFSAVVQAQDSFTLSGTLGGEGLNFSGGGTLILNGSSSYSGSVAITEGAVLVGGGSISPTSGGTLSLGSGSLSFGSGTLVIGNGTPGPDSSTLALNSGTLILNDGSTITLTSGDYLLFNTGSLLVGSSAFGIMNPTPFLSETMVGTNGEVSSGGSMVVNVIQPYSFTSLI